MRLRNAYKFPLQNLQSLFSNIAQIDCNNFAIVFLNLFIFLFLMLFYQTWFFFHVELKIYLWSNISYGQYSFIN